MKRVLVLTLVAAFCAAALFAAAQQRGGVLQVAVDQGPIGLDPHIATAFSTARINNGLIYEALTEIGEDLTVRPALAQSWTVSADNLTYTFQLRPVVFFHNGRLMTAEDVAYSLRRILDPATGSPLASLFERIEAIDTPSAGTLVIRLKSPFAPILAALASSWIVPREVVEREGNLQRTPMGTGPFKFKTWVPDGYVELERHTQYWRQGLPYLAGVRFNIVPDSSTRITGLRQGAYHMLPDIDPAVISTVRGAASVGVLETQDLAYSLLGINTSRRPFDDPRVRQAIDLAIDRDALIQAVYDGNARPGGALSPALEAWALPVSEFPSYRSDPAAARRLLAQAGFPTGLDMTIITFGTIKTVVDAAQVLQAMLSDVGIRARISVLEFGQFVQDWRNSNFDGFVSLNAGFVDPDGYLHRTFVSGGSTNVFKYRNSEVDRLLEQGRTTTDPAVRKQIYDRLQRILIDQAPVIHLAYGTLFTAARDNVQGYVLRANRQMTGLRETWLR